MQQNDDLFREIIFVRAQVLYVCFFMYSMSISCYDISKNAFVPLFSHSYAKRFSHYAAQMYISVKYL